MVHGLTRIALAFLLNYVITLAYDNGELSMTSPPMGWSTWCTNDICGLRDICTQWEVKKRADALVESGMSKLGYNFIFLDDCWASTERDGDGKLQPDQKQFPSGMKDLADYVHSKGLYLSLYTCIGTKTCKKNRPGSYGNYELDAQTFAEWGVDMVKCDNCNNPKKEGETTQSLFTDFSKAMNATGREMLFALCEWGEDEVWNWGPDISQMYRVQMDHLPLFNWGKTAMGVGYGQGVNQIINWMADIRPSKFAGPGAWADPDFLMTMFDYLHNTMPYAESRTEFTFWALWSSPLLVATDVVDMDETKKSILMNEEVLAVHHDPLWIAGDRLYNNSDGTQAWSRPLANGDVAVVLFNADDQRQYKENPASIAVELAELGFKADDEVYVRDLWAHVDLGSIKGSESWAMDVGHHESMMLRLSKTPTKEGSMTSKGWDDDGPIPTTRACASLTDKEACLAGNEGDAMDGCSWVDGHARGKSFCLETKVVKSKGWDDDGPIPTTRACASLTDKEACLAGNEGDAKDGCYWVVQTSLCLEQEVIKKVPPPLYSTQNRLQ